MQLDITFNCFQQWSSYLKVHFIYLCDLCTVNLYKVIL